MKNAVVVGVVVLTVLSCAFIFKAHQDLEMERAKLVRERYVRMEAEENLQKTEGRIKSLERELADSKEKLDSIRSVLNTGSNANVDLKTELEALKQAKEELEQKVLGLEEIPGQPAENVKQ
ncbi:MAG: hypothetical protein A2Z88_11640 [Omnitrophica WOR_2 bacterium GWA2_47_8]|nr:MAG: hypothetical protein A2Z88_11640 [Omnitrophica WOR_2 bacterium GWA2_47_8]